MTSLAKRIEESDTLILGAVTVFGQALVFAYMGGRLSCFGIPLRYLSFRPTLLFVAIISLLIVAYFGTLAWAAFDLLFRAVPPPLRFGLALFAGIWSTLILLILASTPGLPRKIMWLPVLPVAVTTVLYFGWPLFALRKRSYLDSLKLANDRLRSIGPGRKGVLARLWGSLGNEVIVAGALLLFSWVLGAAYGRAMTNYTIAEIHGRQEMVVLYSDDTKLILAPFDRQTRTVSNSHFVLPVEQNPALFDIKLTPESIGPLTLDHTQKAASAAPLEPEALLRWLRRGRIVTPVPSRPEE